MREKLTPADGHDADVVVSHDTGRAVPIELLLLLVESAGKAQQRLPLRRRAHGPLASRRWAVQIFVRAEARGDHLDPHRALVGQAGGEVGPLGCGRLELEAAVEQQVGDPQFGEALVREGPRELALELVV